MKEERERGNKEGEKGRKKKEKMKKEKKKQEEKKMRRGNRRGRRRKREGNLSGCRLLHGGRAGLALLRRFLDRRKHGNVQHLHLISKKGKCKKREITKRERNGKNEGKEDNNETKMQWYKQ